MSERNDGGPAYPVADFDHQTFQPKTVGDAKRLLSGMSLRDWFAGQALPMCMTAEANRQECAGMAYAMADAMLAAREGS